MRFITSGSLTLVASLALANVASAAIVFSDDFDGPTTFWRARQNYDGVAVHPPDVGAAWQVSGVLRDGSDAGYFPPLPTTGGTFYMEPLPRADGFLTTAGGDETVNQLTHFSWDFYVQGYTGAAAEAAAANGTNGLEFGSFDTGLTQGGPRGTDFFLLADGTLKYYTNSGGFTHVPSNSFSFSTDRWLSATMDVDYATGAASLTIGSQTANFPVADSGANRLDQMIFTNSSTGGKLSVLDNIVVRVGEVPEPASLALVSLGALGLLRRRSHA